MYDEVPPEDLADTAAVVAGLRARDPRHPAFVSLFPNYAPIPDYDRYVRDFVAQIRPETIVYDYYPFLADGTDRTGFFANLRSIRRVALGSSTPFWFFAQLTQLPGLRRASESEKRWQALQALAYGARGVMFFTYWSNVSDEFPEPGVIDPRTGLPTAHYAEVGRVNDQARAFGRALVAAKSRSVFHNGPLAEGAVMRPPRAPVYLPSRAPITVGLFESARYRYAMLANRDYRAKVSATAALSFGASRPERLDLASGRWVRVRAVRMRAHSVTVRLALAPAAGALFRIRKPHAGWSAGRGSGVRPSAGRCCPLVPGGLPWSDVRAPSCELARVPFRVRPGGREGRVERLLAVCQKGSGQARLLRRQHPARLYSAITASARGRSGAYRVGRRFSCPRRSRLIGRLGQAGRLLALPGASALELTALHRSCRIISVRRGDRYGLARGRGRGAAVTAGAAVAAGGAVG